MPFMNSNNIKIYYRNEGLGCPIIFIHGLSDSSDFWNPLIDHYSKEYNTIAQDLRGYGRSSDIGNISIRLLTEDLNNLFEELEIKIANIVGFSLGALLAQNFYLEYPEKVRSLTLCSSFGYATAKTAETFRNLEKLTIDGGISLFFDEMIKLVYTSKFLLAHNEYYDFKQSVIELNSPEIIIQSLRICEKYNIKFRLSEIDVPTLIICGSEDSLIQPMNSIDLNQNIPDSRLIQLADVGHNIFIPEKIPEIIKELDKFLKTFEKQ
jgi:pimeloyl-ACP methyl ester carboxylesterase